jgi:hypothetical protein
MFSLPSWRRWRLRPSTSFISGIFGIGRRHAADRLFAGAAECRSPAVFHGVIQIAPTAGAPGCAPSREMERRAAVRRRRCRFADRFSFFDFVPDKALVLMVVGLTPFVTLAVLSASRPTSSVAATPSWRARSAAPCSWWPASPAHCSISSTCAPA